MGRGSPTPGGHNRKVVEGSGKQHLGKGWELGEGQSRGREPESAI